VSPQLRRVIIKEILTTEKATTLMTKENSLTLLVDRNSNKVEIKREVERIFNVKVVRVNTVITPKGEKKAYVKLAKEFKAEEIVSKMGLL
jgi:large subunit ribosomal protein L23